MVTGRRSQKVKAFRLSLLAGTALTLAAVAMPQVARAQFVANLNDSDGNVQTPILDFQTSNTTYDDTLFGSGAFTLLGDTGTTLTLTGHNTYSGGTVLEGGTLALANSAENIGDAEATAAGNGLTFDGGTLQTPIGGSITEGVTIDSASGNTLDTDGHQTEFGGTVSGTGTINIVSSNGAGLLAFGGNVRNFSGSAVVGSGNTADPVTLTITNAANLANAATIYLDDGTLQTAVPVTFGNALVLGAPAGDVPGNPIVITEARPLVAVAPGGGAGGATGNGTFDTDGNNDTYNGTISGSGSLTKVGAGTLTLTGDNTYSGGTILVGGVLSAANSAQNIGDSQATAAGNGLTFDGGTLQTPIGGSITEGVTIDAAGGTLDTDGHQAEFGGTVSGTGTINIISTSGAGLLAFGGNVRNFSGGAVVGNGNPADPITLTLTNAANLSNAATITLNNGTLQTAVPVTLGNALTIDAAGGSIDTDGNNSIYAGRITGAGSLTKVGAGTLTLTGMNSYAGGTLLNAGVLSLANSAENIGDAEATAAGNGLTFNGGTLQTPIGGSITEGVTITANGGTLDTDGHPTEFGGTVSGNGTISIISSNGAGSLAFGGNVRNFAGGAVVGNGVAGDPVTLTLTNVANLSSAASITLNNGTLQTAVPVTLGNQILVGMGGATFDTDGNNDTVTSQIADASGVMTPGTLDKVGAGTLTLTAANTYTGDTTVSDGTLQVGAAAGDGASLVSSVTVQPGASLTGFGTLGGNLANSGGTVSPGVGTTVGTLTVAGNYTQSSAGTFGVQVTPTAASRLNVGGTSTIDGTLALAPASGTYAPGTTYTILSATGGVSGRFATVTNPSSVLFDETYLPNAVDLTVASATNPGGPVTSAGGTTAISGATGAISSVLPVTSSSEAAGLASLGVLGNFGDFRAEVGGVLGELRADIATIDLANLTSFQNFIVERMDQRMGLTSTSEVNNGLPGTFDVAMVDSDQALFGASGGNSVLTLDQPSFWVHGYGVLGSAGGERGFEDFNYQTGGIVAGVDAKVTDTTLIGAAVAYEHTDFHLSADEGLSNTIDTYRVTVYGSQKLDPVPLTMDAALGYAFNDYHDNDFLAVPGFTDSQTSRHDGNELTAETGFSHAFDVHQDVLSGALRIVPRVGVEYDNIAQSGYATTGASTPGLNLLTNANTLNALRSTVGARADLKLTTNDGTVVTPEIRATYLHDFMDTNQPLTEAFEGSTTAGFQIRGVHPGRDAALAGAGVTAAFSENISATIGYDVGVRQHETDHTIQVGVKYTW